MPDILGGLFHNILRVLHMANGQRLQIFTYHRVSGSPETSLGDDPSVEAFREQVRWITDMCRVLPLDHAVRLMGEGRLPPNCACITFDDGYRNNLTCALPVLEAFDVPATIFLAVEPVIHGIMWNDLFLLGAKKATETFDFEFAGERARFVPGETDGDLLLDQFKYLDHDARWEAANAFFNACSPEAQPRVMLEPEEVASCQSSLIDFGAHTVSHPILSNLDDTKCRAEIFDSRRIVSEWCGRPVSLFAYPNGRPGVDFGMREMQWVKEAGFSAAVTTQWGYAKRSDDPFCLPRYTPWESTERAFKLRILKTNLR